MRIDWILLLFNRPEHSKRALESLAKNNIDQVFVYLDHAKDSATKSIQNNILNLLNRPWPFKIYLTHRTERYGLARSVCSALNTAFSNCANAAVLLEDDCILKENGRHFFDDGLSSLAHDTSVRSLCGYTNPNCPFVFEPASNLLALHRFSTWGWATWSNRWDEYNRYQTLGELLERTNTSLTSIEAFAPDLFTLCQDPAYLDGSIDIWSIPWTLLHFLTNTYAIFPIESVIENIGLDGSGSNCSKTDVFSLKKRTTTTQFPYSWTKTKYFFQNEDLIRTFMNLHGLKTFSPNTK